MPSQVPIVSLKIFPSFLHGIAARCIGPKAVRSTQAWFVLPEICSQTTFHDTFKWTSTTFSDSFKLWMTGHHRTRSNIIIIHLRTPSNNFKEWTASSDIPSKLCGVDINGGLTLISIWSQMKKGTSDIARLEHWLSAFGSGLVDSIFRANLWIMKPSIDDCRKRMAVHESWKITQFRKHMVTLHLVSSTNRLWLQPVRTVWPSEVWFLCQGKLTMLWFSWQMLFDNQCRFRRWWQTKTCRMRWEKHLGVIWMSQWKPQVGSRVVLWVSLYVRCQLFSAICQAWGKTLLIHTSQSIEFVNSCLGGMFQLKLPHAFACHNVFLAKALAWHSQRPGMVWRHCLPLVLLGCLIGALSACLTPSGSLCTQGNSKDITMNSDWLITGQVGESLSCAGLNCHRTNSSRLMAGQRGICIEWSSLS